MSQSINSVAVIGAGTMGSGIAHVFALNGIHTTLIDLSTTSLEQAQKVIVQNLDRQIKKSVISQIQKEICISNLNFSSHTDGLSPETSLVIEAIFENKSIKLELFQKLDSYMNAMAIFATNTSAISITELGQFRADRFIGMHFMNPVPVMPLVEIVKGYSTSLETYNAIKELTEHIGKFPVEVNDYPGFISNRILMPMINEAIFALYENVASKESIDSIMKLGMNHPMGPLQLADFIGLDVCLNIMDVLYQGFSDPKYRPCPLLRKMVAGKKFGKKSGEGFYIYER